MSRLETLLPRPQRSRTTGVGVRFRGGLRPIGEAGSRAASAADRLAFVRPDGEPGDTGSLSLVLDPGLEPRELRRPEGHRLEVDAGGAHVTAADPAGLFRGVQTLRLLAEPDPEGGVVLPEVAIEDWPDFVARGVSLDVSRDRVPRMDFLFDLVDRLAAWKIDQLQLYMEHTFAYPGHEEVWREASPFTPEEIRALDRHCRERFVELVPSQNCLAHFHRWLVHDRYRPLAEVPEGIRHPFSRELEPFGLCPTDPRALDLVAELLDALLPNFTSDLVHVGLDEPMDLGTGRSREACERLGKDRVFLDHLRAVRELAGRHGKTIQFWADWVLEHPEAVSGLPDDAIAMAWGYEADHPFAENLERLATTVPRHYVCPGTSSWNSIGGRTSNALANLVRAARVGHAAGSEGYLIADWGDHGHWQPPVVSMAGTLMGAAAAWNVRSTPSPAELARSLDALAFGDEAGVLGRAALELGDAHLAARTRTVNGSAPFFLLHFADEPLPHQRLVGLDADGLEACASAIEDAVSALPSARSADEQDALELRFAADLMLAGCRLGLARLRAGGARPSALPRGERDALAGELAELAERHRSLWTARSRPGGLRDSAGRMERLVELLSARPSGPTDPTEDRT